MWFQSWCTSLLAFIVRAGRLHIFFIKGPCFSCLLYPTMECGPGRENCNTLGKILCRFSHWFKTLFSNTYDYICISPGKYLRLNILAYVYYINVPTLYNLTSHIMEFSLLYIRNYKKAGSLSLCTLYIVHCGIHDQFALHIKVYSIDT